MPEGAFAPEIPSSSAETFQRSNHDPFEMRQKQFAKFMESKGKVQPLQHEIAAVESRQKRAFDAYRTERDLKMPEPQEMKVFCADLDEALKRTMELMGHLPQDVPRNYLWGKFDPRFKGVRIGFSSAVETFQGIQNRAFRFDNDPKTGPHVNVQIYPRGVGKNDRESLNVAFVFPEYQEKAREEVPRMVDLTGTFHGYIQQKV